MTSTPGKQNVIWSGLERAEAQMNKTELADKLDHLDPGATLTVEQVVLASLFGAGTLTKEAIAVIEAFALDHRCIFAYEHGKPSFEKDDIV
jgi:hypothetical protein